MGMNWWGMGIMVKNMSGNHLEMRMFVKNIKQA